MTLVGLCDVLTNQHILLSKLSSTEYMTILPIECDKQIKQQKGLCVADCYHDIVAETEDR